MTQHRIYRMSFAKVYPALVRIHVVTVMPSEGRMQKVQASGSGVVRCTNGQSMKVKISAKGGGLSFGKSRIDDGIGTFSDLYAIEDVIGGYATAEAHAGAVKSATARVVTKGPISLALTGKGIELQAVGGHFNDLFAGLKAYASVDLYLHIFKAETVAFLSDGRDFTESAGHKALSAKARFNRHNKYKVKLFKIRKYCPGRSVWL